MYPLTEIILPLTGGVFAALFALFVVLWLGPARTESSGMDAAQLSEPRWFRFRDGYLTDHSDNVSFLLPAPINHLTAWESLIDSLSDVHESVPEAFEALKSSGRTFRLDGVFGPDRILITGMRDETDIRVTVSTAEERQKSIRMDLVSLRALEDEIELLSKSADSSPGMAWAVDTKGQVIWANRQYLSVVEMCKGPDAACGWPLHRLFPQNGPVGKGQTRRKVQCLAGADHWFEVVARPAGKDGMQLMHAQSLDAVIDAEEALRTFIQTLTRSFAFLPNGLAIFDRRGDLVLFNPALLDLTCLDAGWLSRRPKLGEFLDAMRARQRLSEPRDYKAWRQGLTELGKNGAQSAHEETWTLPEGRTFRMTARPQGDGAVTLLLEDITDTMATTRTHRDEKTSFLRLLDQIDEAIVVFDRDGNTVLANEAARDMWIGADSDTDLPRTLDGCIAFWKTLNRPSHVWSDLRSFLRGPEFERSTWNEQLIREDGTVLTAAIGPLPGGRVSLRFLPQGQTVTQPTATLPPSQVVQA